MQKYGRKMVSESYSALLSESERNTNYPMQEEPTMKVAICRRYKSDRQSLHFGVVRYGGTRRPHFYLNQL